MPTLGQLWPKTVTVNLTLVVYVCSKAGTHSQSLVTVKKVMRGKLVSYYLYVTCMSLLILVSVLAGLSHDTTLTPITDQSL